jgi:serine/threonine-protein kinase
MAKREKDGEWQRFRVIRQLGSGAFGRTFLVSDSSKSNEEVVIKVPHDKQKEESLITELMNAGALSASLTGMSHPNICKCLGFGKFEGLYVMILEYIPGKDLRKIIGPMQITRPPMPSKRATEIVTNVCAGLAVAHKVNLLHRDIKPDNILIHENDDSPKILDFGISKIMQSSGIGSGTVVGTFPYMAPEALTGHSSMASDTWSLTVTLYEMITGRLPFWDENLFVLKQKIDTETPLSPRQVNPAVDERLSALVMRGLSKDPKERFHTAQSMLDALVQTTQSIADTQNSLELDLEMPKLREALQSGREADAEQQARKLLERMRRQPKLYMFIGEACNRRQQYLHAEKIVRQGIQECPDHAGLYFYLAPALWNQGGSKQQEAVAALERAVELGLPSAQAKQARNLLRSWGGKGGPRI